MHALTLAMAGERSVLAAAVGDQYEMEMIAGQFSAVQVATESALASILAGRAKPTCS